MGISKSSLILKDNCRILVHSQGGDHVLYLFWHFIMADAVLNSSVLMKKSYLKSKKRGHNF